MTDTTAFPKMNYDRERLNDPNIFRTVFGKMPDHLWLTVLKQSVTDRNIVGVEFPAFPDPDLQSLIQGSSGEEAIQQAFDFYQFVKAQVGEPKKGARFLDYGAGWGRILRPFLRDFDLADIYAYEPNPVFRAIARSLNAYVCILPGEYMPNGRIPPGFDLIVGYSVFSHLSAAAAEAWLGEFARVLNPGGFGVFTTWGERFLTYLISEQARIEAGEDVHWYSRHVLEKAGDVEALLRRARAGEFIWFDTGHNELYGEAFLSAQALADLIARRDLPFEVVAYDTTTLPQDAFIIRRR